MLRGRFESASAYAQRAYEGTVETGQENEQPFALTIKALVDAHLGRVEAAREATDEGMSLALRLGVVPAYLELRAARGFLELSLASYEEAHRFLDPLREDVAKAGFGEPASSASTATRSRPRRTSGSSRRASLLSELEERGEALQHQWARRRARCRGSFRPQEGPRLLSLPRAPSSCTRASVSRSSWPERTGHGNDPSPEPAEEAARDRCRAALDSFEQIGARLWPSVPAPSWRIGGRALAPTHHADRAASRSAVAAGGTYREVADALFISPKTVQWNLSKIYRKLGIRSRSQLAASLAAAHGDESTPAEPPVAR
jgi:hypothetical protein